jgi:hypothetical protein
MGAMIVEVCPEIEQLVFEIRSRPEQRPVQVLASNGADRPHEWMGQGTEGTVLISVTSSIRKLVHWWNL